jgi:cell division septation protein DedD
MRNNETGEFELVVGNRQLLSGFFIVVLLFAVAFAMGYILGQNSPRSAKLQADASAVPAGAPAVPQESRPQPVSAPPAPVPQPDAAATAPDAGQPADSGPQPTTQPARDTQPAASATAEAPPPQAAPAPASGSYWQVIAVKQSEAEILVKSLKEKGYPASMTPGPNNLMRVIVGPYGDTQTMGRVKTELENLNFHPIRK